MGDVKSNTEKESWTNQLQNMPALQTAFDGKRKCSNSGVACVCIFPIPVRMKAQPARQSLLQIDSWCLPSEKNQKETQIGMLTLCRLRFLLESPWQKALPIFKGLKKKTSQTKTVQALLSLKWTLLTYPDETLHVSHSHDHSMKEMSATLLFKTTNLDFIAR